MDNIPTIISRNERDIVTINNGRRWTDKKKQTPSKWFDGWFAAIQREPYDTANGQAWKIGWVEGQKDIGKI